MQNSPVSALPAVVTSKLQVDGVSASGIPPAEAPDDNTFESLLAQQTQAQPVSQSDELVLLVGQQGVSTDETGKDDFVSQEDQSAMVTDLAALFATLIQAAAPTPPGGAVVASTKAGADVAKSDEVGAGARSGALAFLPGKEAAETAGAGKDLPFIDTKDIKGDVDAKVDIVAFQSDKLDVSQKINQVDAPHSEAFPSITGVQGKNEKGVVAVSVEPRVGAPGWDGALGQKVVWLVNQRHQTAEMQLNPPNLGPLEVKITIANDQASALFVSHHAAVRDAIEAALPRLREMLAESGITLGNAQVSAESYPREQHNGEKRAESGWRSEMHGMEIMDTVGERTGVMRLPIPGSVDIFA